MRFDEFDFAKPYITSEEKVLWQGRPEKKLRFSRQDIVSIGFGILWCGLLISNYVTPDAGLVGQSASVTVLMLLLMLLFGFAVTIGRVIYGKIMLNHTAYVITTRKIIRRRGKRIDTLEEANMPEMRVDAHADGSGTIHFTRELYSSRSRYEKVSVFALDNIAEVAKVQQIIYDMEKK